MSKKHFRIFGLAFVIIGFIILASSLRLTGFSVFGDAEGATYSIAGILLIAGGIILIVLARDRHYTHFRSRAALRQHNGEAHWAARMAYAREKGHSPSRAELRAYERRLHDSGEYESIVDEGRREH